MGIVLTALLFGSFVFCMPATSHAIGDPDIRARITNIRRSSAEDEERMRGTIMVESEETNAKLDKANLIITAKTRVRVTFEDFKIGQLIEAQFVDGPTVMIYPLQVAAAEIVILNNVVKEE